MHFFLFVTSFETNLLIQPKKKFVSINDTHLHRGCARYQRFLLNPAAFSEDHMVQFRFLGILMAVAIRTKKPLDLHLAPWVWKQLCSMPLGGADLEEVDLLTFRTLQGILHLENSGITEDNFHVVRCCVDAVQTADLQTCQSKTFLRCRILWFLTSSFSCR